MSKLETIKELVVEQMPESPERQKALQAYIKHTGWGQQGILKVISGVDINKT